MLARAFYDDPVFGWFFPAGDSRHRRLRRFFVTELRHESLRHGAVEVACVDGRVAGAAAWFPPGTSFGTEVSALPGYLRAFGRRLVIVSQYQSVAIPARPREEPHWYLAVIGVDPVRQGYGVGRAAATTPGGWAPARTGPARWSPARPPPGPAGGRRW